MELNTLNIEIDYLEEKNEYVIKDGEKTIELDRATAVYLNNKLTCLLLSNPILFTDTDLYTRCPIEKHNNVLHKIIFNR